MRTLRLRRYSGCLGGQRARLIDNWLRHIKDIQRFHWKELGRLQTDKEKVDRLCELNVIEQVVNVCQTTVVQGAWKSNQELAVHGWIYNLADGILKDLNICITNTDEMPNTLDSDGYQLKPEQN